MGEARRRKVKARGYPTAEAAGVSAFLDSTVFRNPPATLMVGISPLVRGIDPAEKRHWYFVLASADADGQFHLDCLKIEGDDHAWAERTRAAMLLELLSRRPTVINDFDDEVRFAAFCAGVWPSERTRKLYTDIKAEHDARQEKTHG
jgi:hypothetical protein